MRQFRRPGTVDNDSLQLARTQNPCEVSGAACFDRASVSLREGASPSPVAHQPRPCRDRRCRCFRPHRIQPEAARPRSPPASPKAHRLVERTRSEVLTDGLRCWNALDGVVGSHRAIRTGSGRQAARMAPFKWVNTTLGNIKSAITGTYRKLGPDHAQRYLASFAWRYNRRYQLNTMIPRFVHSAARTQPIPYRALIAG